MKVNIWEEVVSIPTYEIGEAEKNPLFLEKRVYQGSSGAVYPYPVVEKIFDDKHDKDWKAVFIENKYLKIMILPELGGRVQMAFDKTKNRHFIYYNHVIKPALVGLTGPWISGGLEFNWPQHHRPTTYDPVDHYIENNIDGSKTVWCSEIERMFRTKGMAGFTLHPDKAYLEIKVQLYNRTPHPQTFLWWANPAVHVNDHYQSVFPPDVNAVFDHGKRDVSHFPIAKGTYYKVDYSAGVDISRYKNIPVPTSYMAITSKYNFVGGYEHDTQGGLLHVANHHVSPGKKQWTWGHGDFGVAWDRNLTDEDGPYIELMCGVYTDNQPDFSWIMPYEEKSFTQYFMPYRDLGLVKNATKEALVNLELDGKNATIKAYTTAEYPDSSIVLKLAGKIYLEEKFDFSPNTSFSKTVTLPTIESPEQLIVSIIDSKGKTLVSWSPEKEETRSVPEPAQPAKSPKDVTSIEQLYLTGLHLEQYRHATYSPIDYYEEALQREPGDVRCNNAMGLLLLRKAQFKEAETHFRRAIQTLTQRNPNPYDGESFFNLGITLKWMGRLDEAYDAFYKSAWNAAWQDSAYFHLAQLDAIKNDWNEALNHINRSLIRNSRHHKGLHLKAIILRKLGQTEVSAELIEEPLKIDRFNFGVLYEKYLLSKDKIVIWELNHLMRSNIHSYIEIALDYGATGCYEEAIAFLEEGIKGKENPFPLALYFIGWCCSLDNNPTKAKAIYKEASLLAPDYCFPNQIEATIALEDALSLNPADARALYYLGNFWYHTRQYEKALDCWERSVQLDNKYPTAHRNLALVYFNKKQEPQKALQSLETAFSLNPSDHRVLMELDQLYKRLNYTLNARLQFLEKYPEPVNYRDDLYLERATLYNLTGNHQKAYELISTRKFHPWEGGEGKVTQQYVLSLVEKVKKAIIEKQPDLAASLLKQAFTYPDNLGEGKLFGAQENDLHFWLGCAFDLLGDHNQATLSWTQASVGQKEPSSAFFYNDQQPDKIFYQGLALLKLNKTKEANERFDKLIEYGEKNLSDQIKMDYFAVSLPDLLIWDDDLDRRNHMNCQYLIGLGLLGKNELAKASQYLSAVLSADEANIGARIHLNMITNTELVDIIFNKR